MYEVLSKLRLRNIAKDFRFYSRDSDNNSQGEHILTMTIILGNTAGSSPIGTPRSGKGNFAAVLTRWCGGERSRRDCATTLAFRRVSANSSMSDVQRLADHRF
jgi:hypothetical protein